MNKFYELIKRSNLLLLALCVSLALSSCEGDEGAVGPQGEQGVDGAKGDQGTQGEQGEDGEDGESALLQAGFFEGTITGTRQNGTPFVKTFKYEFTEDANEVMDGSYIWMGRYSNANWDSPYASIEAGILNKGTADEALDPYYFYITLLSEIDAKTLFSFTARYDGGNNYTSDLVISNYERNTTTGIMSFDFTYTGDGESGDNTTGNEVTITGKFNSGNKIYEEVVSRKGN